MYYRPLSYIVYFLAGCCLVFLVACSTQQSFTPSVRDLPPLAVDNELESAADALQLVEDYKLLMVTPAMAEYTDRFISTSMKPSQRAIELHRILRSQALLGVEYQLDDTLTAEQVFYKKSANCISFSNLYIALARYYGLDASYQLLRKHPQWSRSGLMVSMEIHVNIYVDLAGGSALIVDIDTNKGGQRGRPQLISDQLAKALFYTNLSVPALAEDNIRQSFGLMARAIQLAPTEDVLWSNIGAIYRRNQQYDAAETAYHTALKLNPDSFSAANNLVALYLHSQQSVLYQSALERVNKLRIQNPYYHFYLARQATENKHYHQAMVHLEDAMAIKSNDPEFIALKNQLDLQLSRPALSLLSDSQTSSAVNDSIQAD